MKNKDIYFKDFLMIDIQADVDHVNVYLDPNTWYGAQ